MFGVNKWYLSALCALAMGAQAQTSDIQSALQVLLAPGNGAAVQDPLSSARMASASSQMAMSGKATSQRVAMGNPLQSGRPVVQVVRGMTLARLLSGVSSRSGVPRRALYAAFVRLNPHAFIGGNPNRLKAGVSVAMFTPEDLNALAAGRELGDHSPERGSDDRRNWIRYP